jgi:multisubunit Na+/H+ antiporter MnhB subunit
VLRLPWKADRRQLRVFGVVLGLLLAAPAARALAGHRGPGVGLGTAVLGAVGVVILVLAGIDPPRLRGIYLLWLVAVAPVAWVVSYLLLGALYFLVITPIGLARRLLGHDALALRRPPAGSTLWRRRPPPPPGFESYRRQV